MLAGLFVLFRGFYTLIYESNPSLFGPSALNAVFFGGAGLMAVGWTFGFILMTDERLLVDARATKAAPEPPVLPISVRIKSSGDPVSEGEIREQVQRIIASEFFRRSARMERFLSLAVDRALLGQPERLKEYALGRDVFNRGEDYDPRADAIVRVEAQRLRRKLREYYDSHGKHDQVLVEFHTGSYVPLFRYREREPTSTPGGIPPVS